MSSKDVVKFSTLIGWEGAVSKDMIDVFTELDLFFSKMEAQKLEKEMKKGNGKHAN